MKKIHSMEINYENLFKCDNGDLYVLFKPFISLLPDFRPLDTVMKMKGVVSPTGDLVPESQNNWRILHDEVSVLTSSSREKELKLVESLLEGPEDHDDAIVTRRPTVFPDFFESYQALSFLIPYVSHCLYNVDKFYISRSRIDLLHGFRPSFSSLHMIRDEKIFDAIYSEIRDWPPLGDKEALIQYALSEKSYGLLKAISLKFSLPLEEMKSIQFLEFSSDLFDLLKGYVKWDKVDVDSITENTQAEVLKLGFMQKCIKKPFYLTHLVKKSPKIFSIFNSIFGKYNPFTLSSFHQVLSVIFSHHLESNAHEILKSVIEKAQFPEDTNSYQLCSSIYDEGVFCRQNINKIVLIVLRFNRIPEKESSFPLADFLSLFKRRNFQDGIDYLLNKWESMEELCTEGSSFSILFSYGDHLKKFLERGGKCNRNTLFLAALENNVTDLISLLSSSPCISFDEEFFSNICTFNHNSFTSSLDVISKDILKERLPRIIAMREERAFDNSDWRTKEKPILFRLFYESINQIDLYDRIKEIIASDSFFYLMEASLNSYGEGSLEEKIFFRACKLNIPDVFSIINIDPTSYNYKGLAIALRHRSTDVILSILSDERVQRIDYPWFEMSIQTANINAMKAMINHSTFNKDIMKSHLPIRVYYAEYNTKYKEIIEILQDFLNMESKRILDLCYY